MVGFLKAPRNQGSKKLDNCIHLCLHTAQTIQEINGAEYAPSQ